MFGRKGLHFGKSVAEMVSEALDTPVNCEVGPADAQPSTLGYEILRFGGQLVVLESTFWASKPITDTMALGEE